PSNGLTSWSLKLCSAWRKVFLTREKNSRNNGTPLTKFPPKNCGSPCDDIAPFSSVCFRFELATRTLRARRTFSSVRRGKADLFFRLVLKIVADQVGNSARDGPANFFAHVSQPAERAAENREALGHLPVDTHIERNGGNSARDVNRQVLADFLIGDLANF